MSMYVVYVYMCMYTYSLIQRRYIYISMHICMFMCMYLCIHAPVHYIHAGVYVRIYVCILTVCMCVCMHVYVWPCTCACIHTHTHTHTHTKCFLKLPFSAGALKRKIPTATMTSSLPGTEQIVLGVPAQLQPGLAEPEPSHV